LFQTQFGYHIVQVTKRSGVLFPRLALVTIPFKTSNASYSIVENRLKEFRSNYLSELSNNPNIDLGETIDKITESKGSFAKTAKLNDNSPILFSFHTKSAEDNFIQFAYDPSNSIGGISPIFKDSISRFFCILSSVEKKGNPSFKAVKESMGSDLIKEKKIEILHDRILRYSSKNEIETSLGNGQIPLCGFELQVIGTAIEAYHSGQKEVIVRGNSGLFYVEVTE
jgi:hypothetical protein